MDKVHIYIEEEREFYRHKTRHDLLEHIAIVSGTFWVEDELESWERMVHWPELELLSAFEFLRQAHEGTSVLHHKLRSECGAPCPLGGWTPRGG